MRRQMRHLRLLTVLLLLGEAPLRAEFKGPTDPKAQKTYEEIRNPGKRWEIHELLDRYRRADSQDGGHCGACALVAAKLALKVGDPKLARKEAIELEGLAMTPEDEATAHMLHGRAALQLGLNQKKQQLLAEADEEYRKVVDLGQANAPDAMLADGVTLANLRQDEIAKARFRDYLSKTKPGTANYARAARYARQPELSREKMAPGFTLTTLTGQQLSLDDLEGKVVLVDFWATWCGPCREALPHIQRIAKNFAGQPLVVLSVSLDKDQAKWKEFVAKNHMDWNQYWDGGFAGPLAQAFDVHAIPATFTIDADGVVRDQHVGDAELEGKLRKLLAAAAEPGERADARPGN